MNGEVAPIVYPTPSIIATSAPTRFGVRSKSSGSVITIANRPPWATPASSAPTYASAGAATSTTAPAVKPMLRPSRKGVRRPVRSER
jgi:hypothetical protein